MHWNPWRFHFNSRRHRKGLLEIQHLTSDLSRTKQKTSRHYFELLFEQEKHGKANNVFPEMLKLGPGHSSEKNATCSEISGCRLMIYHRFRGLELSLQGTCQRHNHTSAAFKSFATMIYVDNHIIQFFQFHPIAPCFWCVFSLNQMTTLKWQRCNFGGHHLFCFPSTPTQPTQPRWCFPRNRLQM